MIIRLNKPEGFEHRYKEDVVRIQRILLSHGYKADLEDCAEIWDEHSYRYAAGWLFLPEDPDELWDSIESLVKDKTK